MTRLLSTSGALRRADKGSDAGGLPPDGEADMTTGLNGASDAAGSAGNGKGILGAADVVPASVMLFPLYRRPIFPGIIAPIAISDMNFIEALQTNIQKGNKHVGLFLSKNRGEDEARRAAGESIAQYRISDLSSVHDVGIFARIIRVDPTATGANVLLAGRQRIQMTSTSPVHEIRDYPVVPVKALKDLPYDRKKDVIRAHTVEIVTTLREMLVLNPMFKEQLQTLVDQVDIANPSELADFAACLTTSDAGQLQDVLEALDVEVRIAKALLMLRSELELTKLQRQIQKQLEESISKHQRKYFLTEQMKTIKKELGLETDEKEALATKFRQRLEALTLPAKAKTVIDDEMLKLSSLEPSSAEYNVTRNYLDWLTLLPWGVNSKENLDLVRAETVLENDHYGLKDIKERILEFIAVGQLRGTVQGKILCFVGPPGVGKTSIGKSIASALNREFYRFSVGGMVDVAEIKGHRRTYVGAMPGKFLQCLKTVKTANPVIMIDEIDKIGKGWQGDPASALLEALDPEQNHDFLDHYLDVGFDLSKVLFVCTANNTDTIPAPLLDRMEVLRLSGYVLEEKVAIVKKYLIKQALETTGLPKRAINLTTPAIKELIHSYCREAGVRNLQKHVEKLFRKAAFRLVKNHNNAPDAPVLTITPELLPELVGKPVFVSDKMYKTTPPGVVMGLAWTSLGGATLFIESVAHKKHSGSSGGSMRTTGSLGDVMKESTEIALTFAKTKLAQLRPSSDFFESHALHVHVPEGATPKDGPSAGITMVTALLSLAMAVPVAQGLAMTGEVSLTGKVLPIGGVKEKALAAKRTDVKTIVLPAANKKDWDELDDFVRKGLDVHFADTYDDVFTVAFGKTPAEAAASTPATTSASSSSSAAAAAAAAAASSSP